MSGRPALLVALVMVVAQPVFVGRTTQVTGDGASIELRDYRLTEATLRKMRAVEEEISSAARTEAGLKARVLAIRQLEWIQTDEDATAEDHRRMEALKAQLASDPYGIDMSAGEGSLSRMADRVSAIPVLAAALRRAELTPREFVTFQVVLERANIALAEQRAGATTPSVEVHPENVRFLDAHEAAAWRIMRQWEIFRR